MIDSIFFTVYIWFKNLMMALSTISEHSFAKLFIMYLCFILMYGFLAKELESFFGYENKVRLYDIIVILLFYAVFAFNCYHLYQAKMLEGVKSYGYSYEKTENKQDKQSEPEE